MSNKNNSKIRLDNIYYSRERGEEEAAVLKKPLPFRPYRHVFINSCIIAI